MPLKTRVITKPDVLTANGISSEHPVADAEKEEHLLRQEQKWRLLDMMLSSFTDFAYAFDREGRFLYVNRPLLDLWGLKLEEAVGKNFFDLGYPEELAARLQRQIQEVLSTGKQVADETQYTSPTGVPGYYEYRLSGMIGIGGGIILSPILLLLKWTNQKQTAAISALFIFVNSVAGLAGQYTKGIQLNTEMLGYVAVAFAGGLCGAYMGSLKFPQNVLKNLLAFVLMIAAWKLLWQ